jgi:hypothetical protein
MTSIERVEIATPDGARCRLRFKFSTIARMRNEDVRGSAERPSRVAILVLGMHRSGTSALTGALGLCGAALPAQLIPANENNPKGYFESETLYRLHDELLVEAGTSWSDPCSFPQAWFGSAAAESWVDRIVAVLEKEIGEAPLFAIKDPRLCRLVPLWLRVVERFGAAPVFVLQVRDPLEVASSLSASRGLAEPTALILWLDYFLSAECATRDQRRTFVTYPELLAGWRGLVAKLEADLGIQLPRRARNAEAEVDEFLSSSLHRQVAGRSVTGPDAGIHEWVESVFDWGKRAAGGEPTDPAELDGVRSAHAAAESLFGPALAVNAARWRSVEDDRAKLIAQRDEIRDLRDRVGQLREDARRLVRSNRASLRWAVDRTRAPGERADGALVSVLDAIEKVEPQEVPGIASTGLLVAELRTRLGELEAERSRRTEELAALCARVGEAERIAADRERGLAEQSRVLAERGAALAELREEREGLTSRLRLVEADVIGKTLECERLTAECARLLAELDGGGGDPDPEGR